MKTFLKWAVPFALTTAVLYLIMAGVLHFINDWFGVHEKLHAIKVFRP